jgi:hypothetical protein
MTIPSPFIDPESGNIKDSIIVDKFSFLLPSKAFKIRYTISKGREFPITYEFLLRILNIYGPLKIDVLATFFGFSVSEIVIELNKLINEGFINKSSNSNEIQLSIQGQKLFVDGKPEIVKIEDRNDLFSIELISFNLVRPLKTLGRQAFINLKLTHSEAEKASRSSEKAKQTFIDSYYQYIDKGNDDQTRFRNSIRKIDSITTLYNFATELRADLELKLSPKLEVELQLPKLSDFKHTSDILRIIRRQTRDILSNTIENNQFSIIDFSKIYEDESENLLKQHIAIDKKFMFSSYIKNVFIEQKKSYICSNTLPIIGSPLLSYNFITITDKIKNIQEIGSNNTPIFWIRPGYPFWARSQESIENLNISKKDIKPENSQMILLTDQKNSGLNGWDAKKRYKYYFDSIIEFKDTNIFNNIEIIISPNRFVCAMYYYSIKDNLYQIPIGLFSTNNKIITKFQLFIKKYLYNRLNKVLEGSPYWGDRLDDAFNEFICVD